jgi:hypothetical protein
MTDSADISLGKNFKVKKICSFMYRIPLKMNVRCYVVAFFINESRWYTMLSHVKWFRKSKKKRAKNYKRRPRSHDNREKKV